MKNIIIVFFVIIFTTTVVKAQKTDTAMAIKWYKTLAIKVNPLSATSGFINLQAEKMISAKVSLNLIYLLGFKTADGGGQGFSLGLEYRRYLNGAPLAGGAYIAPFFRYRDISFFQVQESSNGIQTIKSHQPIPYTNYGGGVVLGKQLAYFNSKMLIDFYGGVDYNTKSTKSNPNLFTNVIFDAKKMYDIVMEGFGVRWGVTIGYHF